MAWPLPQGVTLEPPLTNMNRRDEKVDYQDTVVCCLSGLGESISPLVRALLRANGFLIIGEYDFDLHPHEVDLLFDAEHHPHLFEKRPDLEERSDLPPSVRAWMRYLATGNSRIFHVEKSHKTIKIVSNFMIFSKTNAQNRNFSSLEIPKISF